ncbi:hypothetical protein AADG42_02830 [Ammonicoccus fulvus]|uniref:Uncharacterized protein n=1 Tax=Ammonicoccus fulvus TaxID=3138240 RepID=A0ABZ3FLK8_9ACTN
MSELPAGKETSAPEQPTGRRSWGLSAETHDDDQQTRPLRLAARSAGMLNDDSESDDSTTPEESKESPVAEAERSEAEPGKDVEADKSPETDRADAAAEKGDAGSGAADAKDAEGSGSGDKPEPEAKAGSDAKAEASDKAESDAKASDKAESGDKPADTKARNDALFRRPSTVKVEAQDQAHQPAPPNPRPVATVSVTPQVTVSDVRQDGPDRRYSANDLLEQLTPTAPARATRGLRGMLGMKPSQRESDELRDLQSIKTVFKRPVTVMVANPKGGSGKTPVSVLLAAAFGQIRGGGVVAWDNNELRGTLPDRTDSPHRRNIHDLLESLDQLRWSTSQFTDLAHFLNRQDSGNFYTLGSAQEAGHVVTGQNFRQVHELFGRYFQVVVVDTGNNEAAPNWTAAAGEADCLVVPTKWRKDSLIPAARMLESLQDTNPGLLQRTVIAATNGPADSQKTVKSNAASWFGSSHPIVEVPMDPHIAEGGQIDYALLKDSTRRASLRLAAEVATRLIEAGLAAD